MLRQKKLSRQEVFMLRLSFLHVETEVGHDRGLSFLDKVSVCLDRELSQ